MLCACTFLFYNNQLLGFVLLITVFYKLLCAFSNFTFFHFLDSLQYTSNRITATLINIILQWLLLSQMTIMEKSFVTFSSRSSLWEPHWERSVSLTKNIFLQTEPTIKLNVFKSYRVHKESFSSSSLPSSSSSQNALFSFGPLSGGAYTPPGLWLSLSPAGWRRCRTALRRSHSAPASSSAWWTPAADRPPRPPGSSDTVCRSDSGHSTDRPHSHRSAHSSTSLELQETHSLPHVLIEWCKN